jgi:hypothetical protein
MAKPDPTKYPHLKSVDEVVATFTVQLPWANREATVEVYVPTMFRDYPGVNWQAMGSLHRYDAFAYAELIKEACNYAKDLEV